MDFALVSIEIIIRYLNNAIYDLCLGNGSPAVSTTTTTTKIASSGAASVLNPDSQCKGIFPNGSFCHSYSNSLCTSITCRASLSDRACYIYPSTVKKKKG